MTGCSYPPTYDGIGADGYMEWEIAIDNIFATRFMCPRRKVKNAVSVLRHSALSWWESLDPSDKPQTWNDMKLLMRETFVNPPPVLTSYDEVHHLEEESVVIPPAMPNLLQDNVEKSKDAVTENEKLTVSCENLEPSTITPAEHESKDNHYTTA